MNGIRTDKFSDIPPGKLNRRDTLLIGIGNDGRTDDGLGWAFLKKLKASGMFKGDARYRYQLQIEDAELVTRYQQLVFVDAYKGKLESGFVWIEIQPESNFALSTHLLTPQTILYLASNLYGHLPRAFGLLIEGEEWGLKQGLSQPALENLDASYRFFIRTLGV